MYYTNEYLDKRISTLTEAICSSFKDWEKFNGFGTNHFLSRRIRSQMTNSLLIGFTL